MRHLVSVVLLLGVSMFVIADNRTDSKDSRVRRFDEIPRVGMLPDFAFPSKRTTKLDATSTLTTTVTVPSVPYVQASEFEEDLIQDVSTYEFVDIDESQIPLGIQRATTSDAKTADTTSSADLEKGVSADSATTAAGNTNQSVLVIQEQQLSATTTKPVSVNSSKPMTHPVESSVSQQAPTVPPQDSSTPSVLNKSTEAVTESAVSDVNASDDSASTIADSSNDSSTENMVQPSMLPPEENFFEIVDMPEVTCAIGESCNYYFQTTLLFLDQFGDAKTETTLDSATGRTVLSSEAAALDLSTGLEVRLGRKRGSSATEIGWWSLFSSDETASVARPGSTLDSIIDFSDLDINFNNARLHQVEKDLEMHSIDVSHRQLINSGGSFSFAYQWGLRYTEIDDEFGLRADLNNTVLGDPTGELRYDIEVNNHLIGPQIGGAAYWQATSRLGLILDLKGGVYFNFMDHDQSASSWLGAATITSGPDAGEMFRMNNDESQAALLSEIQFGAEYLITSRFRLLLGYRLVAASGIGLAEAQIPRRFGAIETAVDASGSLLLHGLQIGIDGSF